MPDEASGELELEKDPVDRPDREARLAREVVRRHRSRAEEPDEEARLVRRQQLRLRLEQKPRGLAVARLCAVEIELVPERVELVVGVEARLFGGPTRRLVRRHE